MIAPEDNARLLVPLAALMRVLARFDNRGLVIGGVAVSLLGRPRLTRDVDVVLLLPLDDLPRLILVASNEGLGPRIADAEAFARQYRMLLLRHVESGIDVDVSLGMLPFEVEAVERGVTVQVGNLGIRLPTPEDLIILKAVAHRPIDLRDIEGIVKSHPDLDRRRIRHWVTQFARALDMPALWNDIATIVGS